MAIPSLSPEVRPSVSPKLAAANARGFARFLACNVLYPRLAVIALCLLAFHAYADSIPGAPAPVPSNTMTATDWALVGGLAIGRGLDWATTQECLRRPYCQEKELPNGLAHSKAGLAAFEVGAVSLEVFSQSELIKHGHRKAARAMALFDVSVSLGVDAHNYSLARKEAK
jgi:hypothetical protein